MIHASGLSLSLRDGQRVLPVLHDIDLHIEKGEWVSVTGANGSGKSSLVRILNGLLLPTAGEVATNGLDLRSPRNRRLVKQMVQTVFQNPLSQTIGSTPEEDVAFGLENRGIPGGEMRLSVTRALKLAGLEDKAAIPVEELSGGERQRLAIACCMALEPELLIFDEATSMLDPLSRDRIFALARDLWKKGVTVLWVTQRMEELAAGERALVLEQGRLLYDGSPRGLFYGSGLPAELGWEDPPAVAVGRVMQDGGWPQEQLPLTERELEEALCRFS
ncbi:ATP-binding cassette domain-containing protein [Paenibacillus sp. HN-1]|uniref:ATP-binding cassette domain-containing protein n=1 Tax=Paenibacillus TaxID=44249 RepID=UPI001CA9A0EE|nr:MULTISPECIES: ATP-binding cassette domain-containing protein [Paenibacillus]MBY9077794.1 ATP-binding cassette domain-containing protein [Paenibacillus sp. CGMCC 1.18879]MBY9088250.1 ATP-binding cassette domain-containing protein [Paenibacillus sinensis]